MRDILVVRRKDYAYILGETVRGKNWIIQNVGLGQADSFRVQIDYIEDIVESLHKEDLIVEVI